jgi:hypothetical protein
MGRDIDAGDFDPHERANRDHDEHLPEPFDVDQQHATGRPDLNPPGVPVDGAAAAALEIASLAGFDNAYAPAIARIIRRHVGGPR